MRVRAEIMDRYVATGETHSYNATQHCGPTYQQEVLDIYGQSLALKYPNGTVIDLASGKGEAGDYLTERFGFSVLRVDLSLVGLTQAKGERARAFADQLPLKDASVAGVHMKDALVHINNKTAFLKEMMRILQPDGEMVVVSQVPHYVHKPFFSVQIEDQEHHRNTESCKSYQLLVSQLSQDPQIQYIGPLYFHCNRRSTIKLAKRCGFSLKRSWIWQPPVDQPDWFKENVPRFVVHLTKP